MKFLLLFLPLFTYGQTFRVLVLDGDTMFVAPLDTMRYALSLREAGDSIIVVQRVANVNRTMAVVELKKAMDAQDRMLANERQGSDVLRADNIQLSQALTTSNKRSERRGKALWIAIPVAVLSTALHFAR